MVSDAKLKELALAATAGPWHAWNRGIGFELHVGAVCLNADENTKEWCVDLNDEFRETFKETDAQFIAAANPATVLQLLQRIEALRAGAVMACNCVISRKVSHSEHGPLCNYREIIQVDDALAADDASGRQ